ncbi:MAG: J domain-containing protein [Acidimicrobiia bacterium]
MPTRRVALDSMYLPTNGPAYGGVLLGAVVVEHVGALDEDQQEMLPRLLHDARAGLHVPRIAMRYRLQIDTHGLDRSRHRIIGEELTGGARQVVIELDCHGRAAPQVIGAVMAAAALPELTRAAAVRAIEAALRSGSLPEGFVIRRLLEGVPGLAPFAPGMRPTPSANGDDRWRGVPAERRWAMEVLGLKADMVVERDDVQARFRRLARLAHPDHGASSDGAAERLAELAEARSLLLDLETVDSAARR